MVRWRLRFSTLCNFFDYIRQVKDYIYIYNIHLSSHVWIYLSKYLKQGIGFENKSILHMILPSTLFNDIEASPLKMKCPISGL